MQFSVASCRSHGRGRINAEKTPRWPYKHPERCNVQSAACQLSFFSPSQRCEIASTAKGAHTVGHCHDSNGESDVGVALCRKFKLHVVPALGRPLQGMNRAVSPRHGALCASTNCMEIRHHIQQKRPGRPADRACPCGRWCQACHSQGLVWARVHTGVTPRTLTCCVGGVST